MGFLSFEFLILASVAFTLYWAATRWGVHAQNAVSIAIGLFFCASFSPRFCLFLFFESLTAYFAARLVNQFRSSTLLATFVIILLFPLGLFKYFDFLVEMLNAFGPHISTLKLIIPIGISFYTFMAVGYVIDVHRQSVVPEKDFLRFLAFMSFFPQLVAGPIGRASAMLSQFATPRKFDYALAVDGCRQILWGVFKKAVVADLAASAVAPLFATPAHWSALALWLGAFLFTIQIYADFSGYSDMAIGIGKLFGIHLTINFKCPYFATNIADFWRRWHISLTTWFRDYVYIPLGGSRCTQSKIIRNTLIVFLVSGLWHGAAWTFVLWGGVHGLFFLPKFCFKAIRLPTTVKWLLTFLSVVLAWILFRAPSVTSAWNYLLGMVTNLGLALPPKFLDCLPYASLLFAAEWWRRDQEHPLTLPWPRPFRWMTYFVLILVIFFAKPQTSQFIYAQF